MANGVDVSAHLDSLLDDRFDLMGLAQQRMPA